MIVATYIAVFIIGVSIGSYIESKDNEEIYGKPKRINAYNRRWGGYQPCEDDGVDVSELQTPDRDSGVC